MNDDSDALTDADRTAIAATLKDHVYNSFIGRRDEVLYLAGKRSGKADVPREPTDEMIKYGLEAMRTNNVQDSSEQGRIKRIWQRMYDRRPDSARAEKP